VKSFPGEGGTVDKERLWTKNFIIIAFVNFLIYIVFYLLMAVIANFAVTKFNAGPGVAGLVSGIFIIGILAGRLAAARVVERFGSRKILIIGTFAFILTSASYFLAFSLPLLATVRFLHGIAYGIASTATGTIVAQVIPGKRRGEGISFYSMSQILATALGPFIGMSLNRNLGFTSIFLVNAGIAAAGFGLSFFISQPGSRAPLTEEAPIKGIPGISVFLELSAIPISIIVLIVGFNYSSVLSFMSLYSKEIHLEKAASFFFIVYAAVVALSRPFSGKLLDAKGPNSVVYPSLAVFALGMFLLSRAGDGFLLLLSGAVIGLGYGNFLSCGQAISIKKASPGRLGVATATYYMFLDIGFGIGPYAFGSLVDSTGYRGLYLIMAASVAATIALYFFLFRGKGEA
jgi:MFS family permease